jgi:hypothetical protein
MDRQGKFLEVVDGKIAGHEGYAKIHSSADERVYQDKDGHNLIEVFGKVKIYELSESEKKHPSAIRCFKREIVATLKDKDAELYYLLQWENPFRNHPDVVLSRNMLSLAAFIGLFGVQAVVGFFLFCSLFQSIALLIILSLILSFMEIMIYRFASKKLARLKGLMKAKIFISKNFMPHKKEYLAELLKKLEKANNADKSRASSILLKTLT